MIVNSRDPRQWTHLRNLKKTKKKKNQPWQEPWVPTLLQSKCMQCTLLPPPVELLWVKTLHFVLQNVPLRYILPPNEFTMAWSELLWTTPQNPLQGGIPWRNYKNYAGALCRITPSKWIIPENNRPLALPGVGDYFWE